MNKTNQFILIKLLGTIALIVLLFLLSSKLIVKGYSIDEVITQKQIELDQLQNRIETTQAYIEKLAGDVSSLKNQVAILDAKILRLKLAINKLSREINLINLKIKKTSTEIEKAQQELIRQQAILDNLVVAIYQQGKPNYWEIFISSSNFSQLVSKFDYMHSMQQDVNNAIGG